MLDIIASYDDKLALSIKREHIHHAKPRRAPASAAGHAQAMREDETVKPHDYSNKHKYDDRREQNLRHTAVERENITQRLKHRARLYPPSRRATDAPRPLRNRPAPQTKRLISKKRIKLGAA